MPGLDPGIHAVSFQQDEAPVEWIAGSSPAMTRSVAGALSRGQMHPFFHASSATDLAYNAPGAEWNDCVVP
jgi:hypothetical protein